MGVQLSHGWNQLRNSQCDNCFVCQTLVSLNQKAKIYCDLLSIFGNICTVCFRPSSIISDASHWDNLHKNVPSFTIILWWMLNEGKVIFRRGVHNFHKQTRGRVVQLKVHVFWDGQKNSSNGGHNFDCIVGIFLSFFLHQSNIRLPPKKESVSSLALII